MNDTLVEPFRAEEIWRAVKAMAPLKASEGLSILLNESSRNKSIKGVTIGRKRLEVGHLLFADDNILFSEASLAVANALKHVIVTYGNASGQLVNFEKSLIFYSDNVADEIKEEIGALLGVRVSLNPEKWRYDGSGKYTVKSGYQLLRLAYSNPLSGPVNSAVDYSRFYSDLWSVVLPAKVKVAMWKICNNYLPTFANLQLRKLNVDNCCLFCKSAAESVEHIMRDCEFIHHLFYAQGVSYCVPVDEYNWKDWLAVTFSSLSPRHRKVLMATF
ncbi:hypothetical protein V6N13_008741 [Hibiscus sabdariffa]